MVTLFDSSYNRLEKVFRKLTEDSDLVSSAHNLGFTITELKRCLGYRPDALQASRLRRLFISHEDVLIERAVRLRAFACEKNVITADVLLNDFATKLLVLKELPLQEFAKTYYRDAFRLVFEALVRFKKRHG